MSKAFVMVTAIMISGEVDGAAPERRTIDVLWGAGSGWERRTYLREDDGDFEKDARLARLLFEKSEPIDPDEAMALFSRKGGPM